MQEVTDPELLKQLNSGTTNEVTDPEILKQLNGETEHPGTLKSAALGAMSGIPGAEAALSGIQSISPDKTYKQAHQELESAKDAAFSAHPVAYGAGKTAGIAGTALVAPEGLAGAALVGGLSGADVAQRPADILADATKGTAEGAALGTVAKGIGTAIGKVPGLAKRFVSSLGKDTDIEGVNRYLENPEAINSSQTGPELAENIGKDVGNLQSNTIQQAAQARNLLSPEENPISTQTQPDKLKGIFDQLKAKYMTNGQPTDATAASAINALDNQYKLMQQQAQANGGNLSELNLKDIIQRLQKGNANAFDNPDVAAGKEALKNLSGSLNQELKTGNPEYGQAMQPVGEQTGLVQRLKDKFGFDTNAEGNLVPTDQTMPRIMNAIKEGKTESYELLNDLKDVTGTDYLQKIKDAVIANSFKSQGPGEGLRFASAGLGYGLGHATGIPLAGFAGAALGRMMSGTVNGGAIAKNIMDTYMGAANSGVSKTVSPLIQKYGSILVNAAKQGGNQLAATHFVLSTSDPEYQKLVSEQQDNNNQ